jgi:CDP-diglyceride synthetase
MNSRMIQIFSIAFLILAMSYPLMRLNGSRDVDIPAFGVLIISLIMITMTNSRIVTLEKTLQELKDDMVSAKNQSE